MLNPSTHSFIHTFQKKKTMFPGVLNIARCMYKYLLALLITKCCASFSPSSHRCYLGLALALQTGGPGARVKEAIGYLLEAMEALLSKLSTEAMVSDTPV